MNIEQLKADIAALYDECLERTEPFHRKLDLFIVPESLAEKTLKVSRLVFHTMYKTKATKHDALGGFENP
jgi:hypothetical protein